MGTGGGSLAFPFPSGVPVYAAVGVSTVHNDQFRTASGARITSDVESTRVFGNINATGTWTFDALLASARAGFLYASQSDESFQ